MEKIIGGSEPRAGDFKYHVGIIGKYNRTRSHCLVCSGGIISDFHVLGNTDCFFDINNELRKIRYYVAVASLNLRYDYKNAIDVLFIYSYTNAPIRNNHYIVVLQLKDSLHLNINGFRLALLILPPKNIVYDSPARVAGYGLKSLQEKSNLTRKSRLRITNQRDFLLTYVDVEIIDGPDCKGSNPSIDITQDFCGKIPASESEYRGLCTYDEGAPLVMGENMVVGVAQKDHADCKDTVHGHLYTKVTYYLDFIRGVRNAEHVEDTVTHINRPYERPPDRP